MLFCTHPCGTHGAQHLPGMGTLVSPTLQSSQVSDSHSSVGPLDLSKQVQRVQSSGSHTSPNACVVLFIIQPSIVGGVVENTTVLVVLVSEGDDDVRVTVEDTGVVVVGTVVLDGNADVKLVERIAELDSVVDPVVIVVLLQFSSSFWQSANPSQTFSLGRH